MSATNIYIVQMIILIVMPLLLYLRSQIIKDEKSESFKIKKTLYVSIIIGSYSILLVLLPSILFLLLPRQDYIILLLKISENTADWLVLEESIFSRVVVMVIVAIGGFLLIRKGQSIFKFFFDKPALKVSKKFIIKTFCVITVLFFLFSYIRHHTNILDPSIIRKELSIFTASSLLIFLHLVSSIILAPFGEEIIFRGIIYSEIRPISSKMATIISSIMWALIHPFSIVGYIEIILFGIFLAYTYNRTKSLIVPIGIHSIQNLSVDLGQITKYYNLF